MNNHTAGAYSLSVLIHGTAGLLAVVSGIWIQNVARREEPLQTVQLVALGSTLNASESAFTAPQSHSVKIDLPRYVPKPVPVEAPPEEEDVSEAAPPSSRLDATTITKAANRPRTTRTTSNVTTAPRTTSPVRSRPAAPTRIDADRIADVLAGSPKGDIRGAALGTSGELEGYFAYLVQKIKNAHVTPLGVNARLKVKIQFMCLANGALSAVKIVESSGDADFDRSVADAVRAVGSVGRPRPDGKSDVVTLPVSMTEGD